MSISLLKKSVLVYKPIILWNILVSLITGLFFVINGFDKPGAYLMALIMKPIGWGFSIVFDCLFFKKQSYFYKNMGLGFRKILTNIIFYDLIIFTVIIIICFICRNFLLTVLPINLINKQY